MAAGNGKFGTWKGESEEPVHRGREQRRVGGKAAPEVEGSLAAEEGRCFGLQRFMLVRVAAKQP